MRESFSRARRYTVIFAESISSVACILRTTPKKARTAHRKNEARRCCTILRRDIALRWYARLRGDFVSVSLALITRRWLFAVAV